MSHLLDVNVLIASMWESHPQHVPVNRWLQKLDCFATCSAAQMGFLRVSMSAGFGATYPEARASLSALVSHERHRLVADDTIIDHLPDGLASRYEISDAHYVVLARRHRLQLATLDERLCAQSWAAGVAVNPLPSRR